jgi:ankyrin repeat protein
VLDIPVPKGCLMILLLSGYDGGLGPGARELKGCGSRQGSQWPLLIARVQRIGDDSGATRNKENRSYLAKDQAAMGVIYDVKGNPRSHAYDSLSCSACVLLAKEDLDPNIRDDQGWPPLTYAAFNGNLRMVKLFLARGDIQANVQQAPPVFHAAKRSHVDVVRRLLQFDTIGINQQFRNSSPLCVASEMGHPEVTRLLLEHTTPPDTNLKTYVGDTALSLAAYRGHLAIINLLLEVDQLDVTATNKFGDTDTALCKAARFGHAHVVKRLYRDTRAKCASDVKKAIEAPSNRRIVLYLEGRLNEQGNFCTGP